MDAESAEIPSGDAGSVGTHWSRWAGEFGPGRSCSRSGLVFVGRSGGRLTTILRRTKTTGLAAGEKNFWRRCRRKPSSRTTAWLLEGSNLLKKYAGYKRDYLLPRLKDGVLEKKMAIPICGRDGRFGRATGLVRAQREISATYRPQPEAHSPADRDMLGDGDRIPTSLLRGTGGPATSSLS